MSVASTSFFSAEPIFVCPKPPDFCPKPPDFCPKPADFCPKPADFFGRFSGRCNQILYMSALTCHYEGL